MALGASVAAIFLSILIGWKKKINAGIIAIAFSFFIEVFLMEDGSVQSVIAAWPSKIVFYLVAIALFFNYATANGTMDLLARKLLYHLNGNARMIPWVIAMVCATVAFLGAGASTPAIIGPIAFSIGSKAGLHPVMVALSVACATMIGGDNPINGYGGVISRGLLEQTRYAEDAVKISYYIWSNSIFKQILVIVVAYILFKGYRADRIELQKPESFNAVQIKQLILLIGALLAMIIPMIINNFFSSQFTRKFAAIAQPQSVMILASILCALFNLGDQKDVIEKIPMNTIMMIAGMSMLLEVAKKAGMIEAISGVMTENVPRFLTPAALVGTAAFLSFFSSGTGVVCPLLYPMAESLSLSMELNPVMLFSCVFIGAMSSSVSPFSTGGAMTIAGCPDREVKDQLVNQMIPAAIIIPIVAAILASLGFFDCFHV